jgi:hypothetical protein
VLVAVALFAPAAPAQDWIARYAPVRSDYLGGRGVAVDSAGNCYVAGEGDGLALVKYSPWGETLWTRSCSVAAVYHFYSMAVVVMPDSGVVLAASMMQRNSRLGLCLRRYRPNGDSVWSYAVWDTIATGGGRSHLWSSR